MHPHDEREREDLARKVETLEGELVDLNHALGHADTIVVTNVLELAIQSREDELAPLRARLDELDEEAGWDGWREDRRNSPLVL